MKLITRKKQNEVYKLLAELYHLCVPEDIFKEVDKYEKMFELVLDIAYEIGGIDGMNRTHKFIEEMQNEDTEQMGKESH